MLAKQDHEAEQKLPRSATESDSTEPREREQAAGNAGGGSQTATVSAECLIFFDELVREKGGDPRQLLTTVHIDANAASRRDALIPYRSVVTLLELAATTLCCPDFGLELARRQHISGILGALDLAMRNSSTIGEAWRCCVAYSHVYSSGARLDLSKCRDSGRWALRFEIVLPRLPRQRQAVELSQLISHLVTKRLSSGRAGAREVWFAHDPLMPASHYADYFECDVSFGRPYNAVFFDAADFEILVQGRDERILELATYFLESRFPQPEVVTIDRVRNAVERQLNEGKCTNTDVAAALGMHPRTLQRHLRSEGGNFESIKDNVRRDAAVHFLRETRLPLKTIAAMLGYSEPSVLHRSCHRWFGRSPTEMRRMLEGRAEHLPMDLTRPTTLRESYKQQQQQ